MNQRVQLTPGIPKAFRALMTLSREVTAAGNDAGVDPKLMGLVIIRASQINACAGCLDMHTRDAIAAGEHPRRIFLLNAWRHTELYTEQERVALELTEAITRLPDGHDVPDELYQQALGVFTEPQYQAVVWTIMLINSFNRLGVPSRPAVPASESRTASSSATA